MINKNNIRDLLMINVGYPTNHIERTLIDSALKQKSSVLMPITREEAIDLRRKGFLVEFDELQQEHKISW